MELEGEMKDLTERRDESIANLRAKVADLENKLQHEKEQRVADIEEREAALADNSKCLV